MPHCNFINFVCSVGKLRYQIKESMRKWIMVGFIFWAVGLQAQEYQSQIYQYYLEGKMDLWKAVLDEMNSEYERTANMELLYDITEAQYGYIAWCLSIKEKKEAAHLLDVADQQIETLLKWQNQWTIKFKL